MRQLHLGRHARKFSARHSRRRLPVLKLGGLAALVVALAAVWFLVPFGKPDPADSQATQNASVPTVERTDGTTRSSARPSLPAGRPLVPITPSLLPPAATATPNGPTWAAPPGTTTNSSTPGGSTTSGPTTTDPSTTGPSTGGTTAGPTTGGPTTAGPTTAGPTTAGPTTTGPTTTGPTTTGPTTSGPTSGSSTTGTPTTPSTSPSGTPTYYKDCAEVRAAGKAPLYRGDPGYSPALDHNGDGIACERGNS
ncbi:excalibur calcium-binding domain-containing protein [Kribbella karoonensis]|uniref:excalibur calcium-binding domain-containing protein n=1 Tax=Kribbella karoonensis TaxID=324851 RepID=UPI0031D90FAC